MEQWVDIPGHSGTYQVSDMGNVRTKTRPGARGKIVKGHDLQQFENSNGYLRVSMRLKNEPKSKMHLVHRIVADAFIPSDDSKPFINHKDGDKHNNNLSNLERCTKSENELHAHRMGLKKTTPLKGELHGGRVFNWDDVHAIRDEYIKGDREHGQCALARKYNTSQTNIHNIVNNKNWIEE